MQKGVNHDMFFSTNFSLLNRHTSTDFEGIFTDHVTKCIVSVLECTAPFWMGGGGGGKGWVVWGGLMSNLNSFRLRFTAASCKKGYSCYISFFTNFALINWTCLIGFGGKFHRSCNLAHTVKDLDWSVVMWFNATLTLSQTSPGFYVFAVQVF